MTSRAFRLRPAVGMVTLLLTALLVGCSGKPQLGADAPVVSPNAVGVDAHQNAELAQSILSDVGKIYALPAETTPTVARITDVDSLRRLNSFYNRAANGQYVIITQDRAILYDPSTKKILDVVPVQAHVSSASSQAASSSAS